MNLLNSLIGYFYHNLFCSDSYKMRATNFYGQINSLISMKLSHYNIAPNSSKKRNGFAQMVEKFDQMRKCLHFLGKVNRFHLAVASA